MTDQPASDRSTRRSRRVAREAARSSARLSPRGRLRGDSCCPLSGRRSPFDRQQEGVGLGVRRRRLRGHALGFGGAHEGVPRPFAHREASGARCDLHLRPLDLIETDSEARDMFCYLQQGRNSRRCSTGDANLGRRSLAQSVGLRCRRAGFASRCHALGFRSSRRFQSFHDGST